jgi:hypothetical protein
VGWCKLRVKVYEKSEEMDAEEGEKEKNALRGRFDEGGTGR